MVLLCAVFMFMQCGFGMDAFAVGETNIPNGVKTGQRIEVTQDDLLISEGVASWIDRFFVDDMISTSSVQWDETTELVSVVPMYDVDMVSYTAFYCEFTTGYVIVSAYADVPSIILEWSDVGQGLSDEYNLSGTEKLVYLSVLEYYVDNGASGLKTLNGETVLKSSLENTFKNARSIENVNEESLCFIKSEKENQLVKEPGIAPLNNKPGEVIDDVYAYTRAKYFYSGGSGTLKPGGWSNHWEDYLPAALARTSDFPGYENHCGPTAITNIIKLYGNKYNNSKVPIVKTWV